jgi:L-alanine-DL-glutamate epimerase-like enolase superfamily enzyme
VKYLHGDLTNEGTITWKMYGNFSIGGGSILEIHTDQGLVGIGPDVDPSALPGLRRALVGQDPFDTERYLAQYRFYVGSGSQRNQGVVLCPSCHRILYVKPQVTAGEE